jgi:predicted nucleic acid-binding protein
VTVLLDTNLVVYSVRPEARLRAFLRDVPAYVSIVSHVEALGFHRFAPDEKAFLEQFFARVLTLDLTRPIADRAIALRQRRKMSLGDALIAATALEHDLTLATHNVGDFAWIDELDVLDPLLK